MTRLSDAILIGSTAVKAQPGRQYSMKAKSGCAIGMAIVGAGGRFVPRAPGPPMVYRSDGLEWWPWTINLETRPCRCRIVAEAAGRVWPCLRSFWLRKMPVKDIITHLFDCHVFGKGDWTIERLAQWVASVEPRKNEPVTPQPKPVAPQESPYSRGGRADLSALLQLLENHKSPIPNFKSRVLVSSCGTRTSRSAFARGAGSPHHPS